MIDLRSLRVVVEECNLEGEGVGDKVSHNAAEDKVIVAEAIVGEVATAEDVELSDN